MGLKGRNKVSAEFSMSSLTDIIFLLLIFFMLTANFVRVESANLPESDSQTVMPIAITVNIDERGKYSLNNKPMSLSSIEKAIPIELRKLDNQQNATITVVADKKTPTVKVKALMRIAAKMRMQVLIATQPKE